MITRQELQGRIREFYASLNERLQQAEEDIKTIQYDPDYRVLKGYIGATKDICNEFGMKFMKDHKWLK